MLLQMSTRFGEKYEFDGKTFYLFPSAERLALASDSGLRECSLGFRAKFVKATAQKIVDEKINLENLRKMSYFEARGRLLEFMGVGLKVADCVLLFSLDKTEAFPVDVWVKRVILDFYASQLPAELVKKMRSHDSLTNSEYLKIGDFARSYFGRYAGYAQEYLYHLKRSSEP
jgi:N-glycosylase/DNA lyase